MEQRKLTIPVEKNLNNFKTSYFIFKKCNKSFQNNTKKHLRSRSRRLQFFNVCVRLSIA